MQRNDAAAPVHVCPGIRNHAIDIVQPPGIVISPVADMDAHQPIVAAALAAKSNVEMPKKACGEDRSTFFILVVSTPPDALFIAPHWRAVEPLIHAPEAVEPTRISGIRVIDDAVFERECAHPRPLTRVCGRV